MWSISPTIIVRKSTIFDRKRKYRLRYRSPRNPLFCGSFPSIRLLRSMRSIFCSVSWVTGLTFTPHLTGMRLQGDPPLPLMNIR